MIHFFNPGHEAAVQNGSLYYTEPSNVKRMQEELACLPAWYANAGDFVLVYNTVDDVLFADVNQNIHFVQKEDLINYATQGVTLWGISPQAIRFFDDLNIKNKLHLNVPQWHDSYHYLTGRRPAAAVLGKLTELIPEISPLIIPSFYTNIEDIEDVARISTHRLLSKAPYSSSGRGLLSLPLGGLTRVERQILHGTLRKQGEVSVERLLDKQLDFAMEFMADGCGRVEFVGYSLFNTNEKGAYSGNCLMSQQAIVEVLTDKISHDLLNEVKLRLVDLLSDTYGAVYKGCIGVDMLIYKEDDGFALHPCVEINMRYNMGYLSYRFVENYLSEGSKGFFYIKFASGEGDMYAQHCEMQEKYPAQFENARLKSGYLPLCPVRQSNKYWAYVLID